LQTQATSVACEPLAPAAMPRSIGTAADAGAAASMAPTARTAAPTSFESISVLLDRSTAPAAALDARFGHGALRSPQARF